MIRQVRQTRGNDRIAGSQPSLLDKNTVVEDRRATVPSWLIPKNPNLLIAGVRKVAAQIEWCTRWFDRGQSGVLRVALRDVLDGTDGSQIGLLVDIEANERLISRELFDNLFGLVLLVSTEEVLAIRGEFYLCHDVSV